MSEVKYSGQTRYIHILYCKISSWSTNIYMWHRLELKYLLFAYVLFRAQRASHQLHKSENWLNWELVVKDIFSRVSYWQLVKNTVSDDFQDRMLKNLNQNPKLTKPIKVSTWFPGIAFHLRLFLVVICLNSCYLSFSEFKL